MKDEVYRPAEHPAHLRVLGVGIAVVVVLLALVGDLLSLALTAILATFGFYAIKALSWTIRRRKWLKQIGVGLAVACAVLISAALAGILPEVTLRGYGIWWPLFGVLLFSLLSVMLEHERNSEADKFSAILVLYPPPDGGEWNARKMEEATEGEVCIDRYEHLYNRKAAFGLSAHELVAMSRLMDFPSELWNRSPQWWESILNERDRNVDVSDRLQEWNCYTPDQAAEEIGVSREEVSRMLHLGELESRTDRQGNWQIRAHSVDEKCLLNEGVPHDSLIPWNRASDSGSIGTGRYPNRKRRTGQFADR